MIELIIGAILGALASLTITHIYYRKSSIELENLINNLKIEVNSLQNITEELQNTSNINLEYSTIIKKYAIKGTVDDPEYPYK